MARVWQLLLRADGDTSAAQKEMRQLQRSTRQFGQRMQNMGRTLTTAVTAPIVALGVLGVQELRETMNVTKNTDAVFKSMGSTMKVTKGELSRLVSGLEKYSAIEGDIIQNAANVGLSFSQLAGNPKLFKATTRAAVDMSAALGQDLQTTMTQLGKAMQNGAKGAAALGKNGTLAKADIEKLQQMAKDGVPIWKQQRFILAAVNKQYAGQGRNVDPIKAITIAIKNTAETLAVLLLPAIQKVSAWLQQLASWVNDLSAEQQKWVGVILLAAAAIGPLLMVVGSLASGISALIPVIAGITLPMLGWVAAVAAVVAALVLLWRNNESFRDGVIAIWDQIQQAVGGVLDSLRATITVWVGWARDFWGVFGDTIKRLTSIAWTGIRNFITSYLGIIRGVITTALALLRGDWGAAWDGIKLIVISTWNLIRTVIGTQLALIRTALSASWGAIRSAAAGAWEGITNAIEAKVRALPGALRSALGGLSGMFAEVGAKAGAALANAIKDAVNAVLDRIRGIDLPSVKIGNKTIGGGSPFSSLPRLARGGITDGLSFAGEAGPEAVIPLGSSAREAADRARVMRESGLDRYGAGAGGGMSVTQHIYTNGDVEATARRVMFELLGSRRVAMGGAV